MAEWEQNRGATDEWYTPQSVFDALGTSFDLDPCSQESCSWVPARRRYTVRDDGLAQPWDGFVWMNPPYGGRNGVVPWLERFIAHGNGIAIVRAYTSAGWFHEWATRADLWLFPKGKTKFVRADGTVGKAPGHGVVLLACGQQGSVALMYAQSKQFGVVVKPW